jgi:alpha-D-xyloside xylohydrolase
MRESMVWYTKLRYRLMPYIYTLAADTWHRDGTIMRGLAMDFGDDPKVLNINDSYMFGPSLLIAPVSQFKAQSRQVYLPSDVDWFDFNSGKQYRGGQTIEASAPYERMPVFVKAGAIIPMGPVMQYVDQIKDAPLIIDVWAGADGEFSLYEDDGVSMGYERGEYSRVDITWNNAEQVLQLAGRQGEFPGMNKTRLIHVRVHAENQGIDGAEVIWRGQYSGDNLRIEL